VSQQLLFNVGDVGTVVLRDIIFVGVNVSPSLFEVDIRTGSDVSPIIRTNVADGELFHLELRQVMPPSSSLLFSTNHVTGWSVQVTGYVFDV